ncbi:hypothetical protein EST38_g7969 [Candolleomyces aberdarensis]|uniref:DUF6699 domain-containing protein n=1 Tax=Candolleomyces aberdarensis TaxID=2316362 RepID=A0A4Q2DG13_9AGAR|nr:hypothetical protein EST38_g7969 [Candolleomyces aberdarensis]
MSSPYIYVPEANYQQSAYYNQPYSPYGSPFVPDLSLGGSPYSTGGGSLPPSPHLGGGTPLPAGPVPFPGMLGVPPDPTWDAPIYGRPRQNSWHGTNPYNPSGLLFAPPRTHGRSNSFGQNTAPPPVVPGGLPQFYPPPPASAPIYSNWNPSSHSPWYRRFVALPTHRESQVYIHPWLNGEAPRPDFIFNLASPTFAPMRIVGPRGETALLGPEELSQPATYPYIHKLTVTHDKIPQWPVELVYHPPTPNMTTFDNMPPISVGDVLLAIHKEMQKGITHHDWAGLSTREETEVARAFQRRCKAVGPQGQMQLRSMGVKRVDYLLDKMMFRGLVRTAEGLEQLKLITSAA